MPRERRAGERGDEERLDERRPLRLRRALRPQQDERLVLLHRLRREEVARPADRHRALRGVAGRELVARRLRQRGRARPVRLVLLREVRLQRLEVRERLQRDALALRDERRLVLDVLQRRVVDGAAREQRGRARA